MTHSSASGSSGSWIVVALLFSLILGGSEIPIFGRKPTLAPFDVLLVAVVFLFLYRSIVGEFNFKFHDTTVFYLSLMFVFSQITSFLFNLLDLPRGFLAVKVFAFGYLSYVLCVSVAKRAKDVERILSSLVLWGAVLSAILIYYYITNWSLIIGQQAGNETKSEIGIEIGRSNYLAALLVPILPLAIAAIFANRRWIRIGFGICAGLMFAGLLITMSKGAFLSLAVGSVMAIPMLWKAGARLRHAAAILLAAAGFLLVSFLVVPDLLSVTFDMFSSRLDTPDFARLDLWTVAWQEFVRHPLLGVGPNAIYLYNRQFAIDDLYTHNFVLNTLAEFGLTGGISFFLLIGVLLRRSYRLCVSSLADPRMKAIALGLFVGLLSTLAHGLVEPTFPGQQYDVIFWVLMALVYLHQRICEQSNSAIETVPIMPGNRPAPCYGVASPQRTN